MRNKQKRKLQNKTETETRQKKSQIYFKKNFIFLLLSLNKRFPFAIITVSIAQHTALLVTKSDIAHNHAHAMLRGVISLQLIARKTIPFQRQKMFGNSARRRRSLNAQAQVIGRVRVLRAMAQPHRARSIRLVSLVIVDDQQL